jgi:NAD(P)-dependent dehydrogenase (short-subunit alcohol dehydrogenase family)
MSEQPAGARSYVRDRVIVITGAGSGFGRSMAAMTARLGAKVVAADIDEAAAAATVEQVTSGGYAGVSLAVDVTKKEEVDRLAAFAVDRFGSLDVLVNNAGVMPLAFFSDHAEAWEAWDPSTSTSRGSCTGSRRCTTR